MKLPLNQNTITIGPIGYLTMIENDYCRSCYSTNAKTKNFMEFSGAEIKAKMKVDLN